MPEAVLVFKRTGNPLVKMWNEELSELLQLQCLQDVVKDRKIKGHVPTD